jgi:hypothetical protein
MRNKLTRQQVRTRRRIPGTGTKVKVKKQYKDTPDNRRKGRVGEYYFVDKYENADYEERSQVKFRRVKTKKKVDPNAPKKQSVWIKAMQMAKEELGVPKNTMLIVRKEPKDPSDETQILGARVYKRAIEIKERLRAESSPKEEPSEPVAESSSSSSSKTKSSKRKAISMEQMPQDDNAEDIVIEHVVKKRRRKKATATPSTTDVSAH